MEELKLSQCHLHADEVNFNLNMLRAPMVNWICYHVDDTLSQKTTVAEVRGTWSSCSS
jgi:hypothetical protein